MIRAALLLALVAVVGCGTVDEAPTAKTDGGGDGAAAVGASGGAGGAAAGASGTGGAAGTGGASSAAGAGGASQPPQTIPACVQRATVAGCGSCRVDTTDLSGLCAEGLRCVQSNASAWLLEPGDAVTNCTTSQPVQACLHALVASVCPN